MLRQRENEYNCDEDDDEIPIETVVRGGEVADKVEGSLARGLFI